MPKFREMNPEQKREYKRAIYHKHKEAFNLAKIATGLVSGSRKVRSDTLEKYNIQQNEEGELVIPRKYKFKINYSDVKVAPPPPVINVVVAPSEEPIEPYDLNNNLCTGATMRSWIATVLAATPKTPGGEDVRSKTEITAFMKIPEILFEIYNQKYNPDKDLAPFIRDTAALIAGIEAKTSWKSSGTKSKFLGKILLMCKAFPPLKHRINKDIYTVLDAQYNKWEGLAKAIQRKKTKETPIFSWDVIKKEVIATYGKMSYEALLILLYDEMIGRDDFQLKMAYKPADMTDNKKTNYLLLERNKAYAAVYMNSFKTVGRYGKLVYRLSPELVKIIETLHPTDNAEYLFPYEGKKLGEFIGNFLKGVPLFKDEPDMKIRYLRHSLISTKLMKINPKAANYDEQVLALAESAMHSVKAQETYTSPLKDAKGKVISPGDTETTESFEYVMKMIADLPAEDLEPTMDKSLIGVTVQNKFIDPKTKRPRMYTGKVVEVTNGLYRVVYEDGDLEDMSEDMVLKHRVKAKK